MAMVPCHGQTLAVCSLSVTALPQGRRELRRTVTQTWSSARYASCAPPRKYRDAAPAMPHANATVVP